MAKPVHRSIALTVAFAAWYDKECIAVIAYIRTRVPDVKLVRNYLFYNFNVSLFLSVFDNHLGKLE